MGCEFNQSHNDLPYIEPQKGACSDPALDKSGSWACGKACSALAANPKPGGRATPCFRPGGCVLY